MSTTPPEQDDVDQFLESDDPTIVQLRDTYTATADYESPRIVETLFTSEAVKVLTEQPAVIALEGIEPESLLNSNYDTRIVLPDFPQFDDPRFAYLVELDLAERLPPAQPAENGEVDEERTVGAIVPFVSEKPMDMPTEQVPPDRQLGPAVISIANRLRQLIEEEEPGQLLAVRVGRRPAGFESVEDDPPFDVGPVTVAWVSI